MGFAFEEIYNLLSRDVDLKNGIVKNQLFGEITIPGELVDVFRNYWNNDIIYMEKVSFRADKTEYFIQRFIPEGRKLTGCRLSPSRINMLVSEFKRKHEEMSGEPLKITGKNLGISGACWRLYRREINGENLTDDVFRYESRISADIDLEEFKKVYQQYKDIFIGA